MPKFNPRRPSVMKHKFSEIPKPNVPRSQFDRSHGYKTTFDGGYLIPIFLDEVYPGDTHSLRGNFFARMNTPIHPIMDNLYFETFFFFVPNRLVWNNWQKFQGEQQNPGDSIDFLVPTITETPAEASLADYYGLPVRGVEITDRKSVV